MSDTLEIYAIREISPDSLRINARNREFPLTCPILRQSGEEVLKARKLRWLNRFFQAGRLQFVGSPWLPGFFVMNEDEAQAVLEELSANSGFSCPLLLGITTERVRGRNWFSFQGDPMMELEIQPHWTDLTSYMADMKKKYRARVRSALKLQDRYQVQRLPKEKEVLSACGELLEHSLRSKVVALPEDTAALLATFEDVFSDGFELFGFFEDERLVGFISTLKDGTTLRAMHFGARDEVAEGFYSLAMFTAIEHAIQSGCQKVNLGRTGTEIKSTYGAKPVANYFTFYTRRPFWWVVLKIAQWRYKPKSYVLRSPFQ